MAGKRAKHCSCSVFGCINENQNLFLVPSSDSLRNQYFNFIFSGNVPTQLPKVLHVCAKHFTDDCFLNLGQYRAGLAQRLKIKSGSLPTLLGSASKLGQEHTNQEMEEHSEKGPLNKLDKTTSSVSGSAVASQAAGEAPCSADRTPLDAPSPMETQEDALDEMEVNTIKVEDENLAEVNDEQKEDGEEELETHEKMNEEDMKGMPVVSSVIKGSVDCLSFCSLDMGVDMIGGMDTGTDEITDQDEEQEDCKKKIIVEEDSSDSMPSNVNSDCTSALENKVKLGLSKQIEKVKVKDEPVDEEYDEALVPYSTSGQVKDEPETVEDNLKISAVFSVGGATSPSVTMASPVLVPTPPKTTLPCALPLFHPATRMACTACKMALLKGQTAYQKKGSSSLFCSTACLTRPFPASQILPPDKTICHYCFNHITNLRTMIKAPVDTAGTRKAFCSNTCLSSFDFKRKTAGLTLSSSSTPTLTTTVAKIVEKCSYCKIPRITQHEVTVQGVVYKLCGDSCFKSFRTSKQLCMTTCMNCGAYCQDKSPQMKVDKIINSFCKAACKATYKQNCKTPTPCTMCHTSKPLTEMAESTDLEGKTDLFCNSSCLTAHKIKSVSSSGGLAECDYCKKKAVPTFHLAMSDSSIRNFCTLTCVLTFQEQFNKSNEQNPVNVVQKPTPPPAPPVQSQSSQTAPATPQGPVKLTCFQCDRLVTTKPEILQFKDKLMFLCSPACSEECKKTNVVMDRCVYCKIEKVVYQVRRINSKDSSFCSEGCKLLYNLDLEKLRGQYCRVCSFCASTSQKLVKGQFGGKNEDFCSEPCRSKFTMLFCQVAKCDQCGRQGKLTETLHMLGEVKHFCDVQCVLQFCFQKNLSQNQTRVPVSIAPIVGTTVASRSTPIIANVVSLASAPTKQPTTTASIALQGAVPGSFMKIIGNASTQTDMARAPPAPPPRILKNKALLCKPMVQNKGIMCKPQMVNSESQTDERFPKVIVLPIPVPVYVPIPMNLYAQYAPNPVGFPIPVPVPMFLPVTLDNAESIVKTILEIKEKIPSNPFEADILLMAEMVAEDGEEDRPGPGPRQTPAPIQDDRVSNYSEDLDTDDIATFLNNWQDECGPSGPPSNLPFARETLPSTVDIPVDQPDPPAQPPVLDIESDFPIETLELMAHWRQQAQRPPSPPAPRSPPRQRPRRKVQLKKKKGHETQASAASLSRVQEEVGVTEPPKLQIMYGVDAWKRWVQWRNSRPDVEPAPRFGSRPMVLKEDVLKCTTAELGFGLCRFISEVQRPDGQRYSPDSLFYLCLCLQQHLFENSRMENIFTDLFYSKFTMEITKLLKDFEPTITDSGYIHSRVEEEYLWGCKQLGAYSPIVLLNTLLFFCTKYFHFRTPAQHHQLSFGHVMRCTRSSFDGSKTNFLRFYPPLSFKDPPAEAEGVTAKRKREEQEKMLEMVENDDNPLRCPVRLYDFYLSKCSESVKQRTNVFYLHPERSCVPNSPLWFSSTPLDDTTMETMLTRILTVREMHLRPEEGGEGDKMEDELSSPPALGGDDDEDSD
ncbi:zinc finger MYM-type protein 4 isoform X3 [Hypomesus transpacificus]|uniref:zinc finger MYM-type protein 4 isoform X3 n=2 Tax=Hypomesus transpacificus TaxID=137520 RepID=UPI001F081DB3|nr:zinc finger MYM-type protein 4 isoform X3 [Hypomesus transpacificus]